MLPAGAERSRKKRAIQSLSRHNIQRGLRARHGPHRKEASLRGILTEISSFRKDGWPTFAIAGSL